MSGIDEEAYGDLRAARASAESARQIAAGAPAVLPLLAICRINLKLGDLRTVLEATTSLDRIAGGSSTPMRIQTICFRRLHQFAEASHSIKVALEREPGVPDNHLELAKTCAAEGDGEGAREALRVAFALGGNSTAFARAAAIVSLQCKDAAAALTYLRGCGDHVDGDYDRFAFESRAHAMLGDEAAARELELRWERLTVERSTFSASVAEARSVLGKRSVLAVEAVVSSHVGGKLALRQPGMAGCLRHSRSGQLSSWPCW